MSHRAAAHMHESGMSELADTGNQQSNKEAGCKKYFMYFENTKILRLNVFKYKIVSCISNTYLKYCPCY